MGSTSRTPTHGIQTHFANTISLTDTPFVWQGDSFRMPQRVVAQSGTFLVSSNLGSTIEDILADYPGRGELLVQFVVRTSKLRADAMASLYSMNITQATLFPGLDGLARSMAYEFEYSWQVDLTTSCCRRRRSPHALA